MKMSEAVPAFDDWSRPWVFCESVRSKLGPEEASTFEALVAEASRSEHWSAADLSAGCGVAQRATKKKFPGIDEGVIALIVRAAAYDWR